MRGSEEHRADQTSPAATPIQARGDGEDVLGVIAAVEAQLASMKRAQAERQKIETALLEREQSINAREQELASKISDLERDVRVVEQERQKLQEDRSQIDAARRDLESFEQQVNEHRGRLAEERAEIDQKRSEMLGDLERRHAQVESIEKELSEREQKIATAAERLASLNEEASERSNKLELRAQQLEQAEARLSAQAERLNERLRELESQAVHAKREAEEAEARARAASDERDEALTQALEAEQQLDAMRQQIVSIESQVRGKTGELNAFEQRASELATQVESVRQQLSDRTGELEEARAALARVQADAAQRIETLSQQIATIENAQEIACGQHEMSSQRIATLERELAEARKTLDQAESAHAREIEALEQSVSISSTELTQLSESLAERDATIAELRSNLSIATDKLRSLGEIVQNQMASGDARVSDALEKAVATAEQLHRRVGELQKQLGKVQSERDALAAELEASKRSGEVRSTQHGPAMKIRRDRLQRMRTLLREQTRKVRRANELLQDRFSQCESLLSRRAELAAAHQAIQNDRKRVEGAKTRAALFTTLAGLMVTLGVLLSLSWVIAEQIKPGTFAAVAVIEASAGPRPLTDEELEEWQIYHEQMLQDPRFVESVADMLKRRGMATLGTPGAVTALFEQQLVMSSPQDGSLHFELRGEGATRTERILDTLTVAVARNANRTRGRRGDGATSVVVTPAQAKPEPIDSERLVYVGSVFGGGFVLTSALGFVLWRRMSSAKSQFERDQQLEALLSEARWQDPRIDIG